MGSVLTTLLVSLLGLGVTPAPRVVQGHRAATPLAGLLCSSGCSLVSSDHIWEHGSHSSMMTIGFTSTLSLTSLPEAQKFDELGLLAAASGGSTDRKPVVPGKKHMVPTSVSALTHCPGMLLKEK